MRCLFSLACWFFLLGFSSGATEEQQHDSTGTMEFGMVFPINETTINPSLVMPFVFSYQNPELVPILQPYLIYDVYNYSNMSQNVLQGRLRPRSTNLSATSDLQFEANYHREFANEGKWLITLILGFFTCYEDPDRTYNNTYTIGTYHAKANITFTTEGPSKQVDLVAATNSKNCSSPPALTVKVQDTVKVPQSDPRADGLAEVCLVDALASRLDPLATWADKCVAMVPTATSSIAAEVSSWTCRGNINYTERPDGIDCETWKDEESMGLRIVFGGTTCLAVLVGALDYML
ncbi:Ff.00g039870.m01.CDS01 [Fusarium sp. VM40]|nr:Ff.00g039870.m01.CDS01 [Fusarium sp. VM40]